MSLRAVIAALVLAASISAANAQGCGQGNPNCVAPTPPVTPSCDNSNRIATTAFVNSCGGGGGGGGSPGGSINAVQYKAGSSLFGGTSVVNNAVVSTNGSGVPNESTVLPNGITATTQTPGDSSTKLATDSFVSLAIAAYVPAASGAANSVQYNNGGVLGGITGTNQVLTINGSSIPAFTTALPPGITGTTQTSTDNTTLLATDAFVQAVVASGVGAVSSVFTRTGAITAQTGDYTASQVTGALVNTNNLSDVSSASTARTNLGLGTLAVANATTPPALGGVTPNTAAFTTLTTNSTTNIITGPFQFNGNTMTFPASPATLGFVVGSITTGHCVQWATGANGGLADAGAACGSGGGGGGSTVNVQEFASPGNFTPGTTTQLTLSSIPASSAALTIVFDGIDQFDDTWSLNPSTGVVTFDAPIPLNTQKVKAKWFSVSISGGTVSSITVNSANGLAGTVVNPTTTPSITLSTTITGILQGNGTAITSIASVGTGSVVLANSPSIASPTFTGTVAGANTIPLSILAQSGANTMLGNWTGSTANVTANSMPSCSDSGGNHLNYVSGTGVTCGTSGSGINQLTGDVTAGPGTGSQAATIANNAVTYAKFQQVAGSSLVGNPTGSLANAEGITLGASLAFSGTTLICSTATTSQLACVKPDGTSIAINGSGVISVIGSPATTMTVGTTTISGGVNSDCLYDNAGVLGVQSCGTATSIADGSTTITSGVNGTFLINNSGVLGHQSLPALAVVWTAAETFNGGLLAKRRTVTSGSTDTVLATDYLIAIDKASGSATGETLFACASGIDGQIYIFKDEKGDAATNNITITPASGTIEGASTAVMNSNGASLTVQCDGSTTNWVAE